MEEKIHCLFILCGILCIHQILADELSDHLVRKKRVINLEIGGDVPLQTGDAPYVANIRRTADHVMLCVGVILSRHTVITYSISVMPYNVSSMEVLVGSSYYHLGIQHNVIMKHVHSGNHQRPINDGIALLTVDPVIIFTLRTSWIHLYQGPLLPGTRAIIYGWGCNPTVPRGTDYRTRLRSITVPIISHADCTNRYHNIMISMNDICTFEANKRCGHTDAGAPLVVNDQLAGIHLWRRDLPGDIRPDIFVNLQSAEYATWITNNIIQNVIHMN